jgi:hypothetical protein
MEERKKKRILQALVAFLVFALVTFASTEVARHQHQQRSSSREAGVVDFGGVETDGDADQPQYPMEARLKGKKFSFKASLSNRTTISLALFPPFSADQFGQVTIGFDEAEQRGRGDISQVVRIAGGQSLCRLRRALITCFLHHETRNDDGDSESCLILSREVGGLSYSETVNMILLLDVMVSNCI